MRRVKLSGTDDQAAKIISTDSDDEVGMNNTVTVYLRR